MKRILLVLMISGFVFALGQAQDPVMYFDFEEEFDNHPEFSGSLWGGVLENPAKTGVNLSDSVGLGKTGNNAWDGFIYYFPGKLDLRNVTEFKMKVYHPTLQGETRLQFEPGGLKLDVMYTTPGEWAELTWTIPDGNDGKIDRVLLCFAHERAAADEEWYFDELQGAPTYMSVGPNTFYSTASKRKEWTAFQNAVSGGVVDNPDPDLTHDAPYAGLAMTGTDTWSGMYIDMAGPIDFSDNKKFEMKVYSDSIGNARIQLEGSGATTMKLSVPYTTPGEWAHLEFDASAADTSMDYTRMVLIFDDKDAETGEEWYFDNITGPWLSLGEVEPVRDYLSFDSGEVPDISAFSGALFGGVTDNPLKDDVNGSDSVGVFYTGTAGWAAMQYWLPNFVDFSEGYTFKLKVYNADSTGSVRVWLEDQAASKKIKVQQEYTTPGEWAELTFDVRESVEALPANDLYLKMLLTFDDLESDIGEEWYFDDLRGPALNAVFYNTGIFSVTDAGASASSVEIDINNGGNKIALADTGSNTWIVEVPLLPVGDHVMDLYVDGALVGSADDVAFSILDQMDPTTIFYTYEVSATANALFAVTVINSDASAFSIDINNGGSPITLYDDGTNGDVTAGDNIWSVLVNDLPLGGHVMDLYADGTQVESADDIAFTLTETPDPNEVTYTYEVTLVKDLISAGILIYPNPAEGLVTLDVANESMESISIFNIQGREVMNMNALSRSSITLDISGFESGMYYIKIEGDDELQGIAKLIVK